MFQFKSNEDNTTKIREKVATTLKGKSLNLILATKMASSELVENAMKYGDLPNIKYELNLDKHIVSIRVSNIVVSSKNYKKVKQHVDQINTLDPKQLFISQLQHIINNQNNKITQLGLYRIAYEGKFDLSYIFDAPSRALTVLAKRKY